MRVNNDYRRVGLGSVNPFQRRPFVGAPAQTFQAGSLQGADLYVGTGSCTFRPARTHAQGRAGIESVRIELRELPAQRFGRYRGTWNRGPAWDIVKRRTTIDYIPRSNAGS